MLTEIIIKIVLHMSNVVIMPNSVFNMKEPIKHILCTTTENI